MKALVIVRNVIMSILTNLLIMAAVLCIIDLRCESTIPKSKGGIDRVSNLIKSVKNSGLGTLLDTIEKNDVIVDDRVLYPYSEEQCNRIIEYAESFASANNYSECSIFDVVESTPNEDKYLCVHMTFDGLRYICISLEASGHIVPIYDCMITDRLIENWEFN